MEGNAKTAVVVSQATAVVAGDSLLADVVEADTLSHGSIVAQVHGL